MARAASTRRPDSPGETDRSRRRLSRSDWVDAAAEVLAADGFVAVAVEPIAEKLGVTKGSFYAHFRTRDDLLSAVLGRWKEADTDEVLSELDRLDDPRERLDRFLQFGFERDCWGRVFAALCASASDPRVDPVMAAVRQARTSYMERALREIGLTRTEARDRATLIYAAYVGFWRLVAADDTWEYNTVRPRQRIAEHIKATLIP